MSSVWGDKLKISLFGESHQNAVGVVMDGLLPGIAIDEDYIKTEMKRRAPGDGSGLTTARSEADEYEIQSGAFEGRTTGAPLCAIIRNTNTRSVDYADFKTRPRPGHADYTGTLKYKGMNDIRGGGHFSARVTAGLVFAGALCRRYLEDRGIYIGAHLKNVYNIDDLFFTDENLNKEFFSILKGMRVPTVQTETAKLMEEAILKAKSEKDSVGGTVETAVIGMPAGCGEPMFDSVESKMAGILYSIPGVKGVEFGKGFDITRLKGSEANDPFYFEIFEAEEGGQTRKIKTRTNNNGGINGGITNGMPIIFRVAMKPTPSIAKEQETVDLEANRNVALEIKGRHDPCIAVRAVPVIEAAAAVCIFDILLSGGILNG